MWRLTKPNAIIEGLHNKMEVISRRAYGFRNFQIGVSPSAFSPC